MQINYRKRILVFAAATVSIILFRLLYRTFNIVHERIAYATLLSQHDIGNSFNNPGYLLMTTMIIRTIRKQVKNKADIIVLVVPETGEQTRKTLVDEGAIIREVKPVELTPPHQVGRLGGYQDQYAKIALWNMTEYSQVIFFDSDMIIKGDITQMSSILPKELDFGAAIDYGQLYYDKKWSHYFNGGMFIIRPSKFRFNHILSVMDRANQENLQDLAEQDFLNWYYGKSFYAVDPRYNLQFLMHVNIEWSLYTKDPKATVDYAFAIHWKGFEESFRNYHFQNSEMTKKMNDIWKDYLLNTVPDLVVEDQETGSISYRGKNSKICLYKCS